MSKDTLQADTKQQKNNSNVIAFPTHNCSNSNNIQPTTFVYAKHSQNKENSLALTQQNDEEMRLVFEILLVLKDQLDNIENRLKSFPKNLNFLNLHVGVLVNSSRNLLAYLYQ